MVALGPDVANILFLSSLPSFLFDDTLGSALSRSEDWRKARGEDKKKKKHEKTISMINDWKKKTNGRYLFSFCSSQDVALPPTNHPAAGLFPVKIFRSSGSSTILRGGNSVIQGFLFCHFFM